MDKHIAISANAEREQSCRNFRAVEQEWELPPGTFAYDGTQRNQVAEKLYRTFPLPAPNDTQRREPLAMPWQFLPRALMLNSDGTITVLDGTGRYLATVKTDLWFDKLAEHLRGEYLQSSDSQRLDGLGDVILLAQASIFSLYAEQLCKLIACTKTLVYPSQGLWK
jgi:hypothetical protein